MSYTRTVTKTIPVHYSDSVYCTEQDVGREKTCSGTVYEDVTITIYVDTDDFESAISHCNNDIDLLTGSVAATEAAQVASIHTNAKKVGDTVLNGFFRTVNSEITQQIAELQANIDATLLHLNDLKQRCLKQKDVMHHDYERLCSRYQLHFQKLNEELENRIHQIDQPVFNAAKSIDQATGRQDEAHDDRVSVVSVTARESAGLNASIAVSRTKSNAQNTIGVIYHFLQKQMATDSLLHNCTVPSSSGQWRYAPVVFSERVVGAGMTDKQVEFPREVIPNDRKERILQMCDSAKYKKHSSSEGSDIEQYFEAEIGSHIGDDPHSRRVKEYMRRFFARDISNL